MAAEETLELQDWMRWPETRAVVAALTAEGAEVRFVGGCVRDALAGRTVADIDLATPDPPDQVMRLLEAAGVKVVATGLEHGTVTAVRDRRGFEVTTLREDVETYGRRAKVAFTDDWEADAARRDFTFNALSLTPGGRLYDPFGGRDDLAAGRVRFVGEAAARIAEDYLRILRFFRFFAHFGRPPADEEALAACRDLAEGLDRISAERIRVELLKLLRGTRCLEALGLMEETGVLARLLPEARRRDRLVALLELEAGEEPNALRRLGALVEVAADEAEALAERLRLSNAEKRRLGAMAAPLPELPVGRDETERARLLYRLKPPVLDTVAVAAAEARCQGAPKDALLGWLAAARDWQPPVFPLGGQDAIAAGVSPGPELGRLLVAVEDWWVEQDFRPDAEACRAKLRELAGES